MAKKQKPDVGDVTLQVQVYTAQLRDHILERVASTVHELFSDEIGRAVRESVDALVKKVAHKDIEKAVTAVLKEGWPRTDEYGGSRGTASLRDRIGEMLNGKNSYGSRERWLDELVKKETEAALKGALAQEIEAARQKLRAEVDQVVKAKLNEALRTALGVGA